jgi:pseudouridine synthase
VGRLDRDSEGLIILTNDGHLTDLLTHPRYEVEKEYLAGLDSMPSHRDLERLVRGIESDGERLRASAVHAATPPAAPAGEEAPGAAYWLDITLKEGRNREIRRMMEAAGRQVLLLRRIRLGPLRLGDLGSGAFRELSADEVEALYAAGKRAEALAAAQPESERQRFVAPATPARQAKSGPRQSRPAAERERFVARPKQAGPVKASRGSRFAAGAPRAAASEGAPAPKAAPKHPTGRPAGKAGGGQGRPQAPRRKPGGRPQGGR